jgi:tRNA G18 (ribose-2'-O)-methylase SpoU
MRGVKTSINVATACGIVLFEILKQHHDQQLDTGRA